MKSKVLSWPVCSMTVLALAAGAGALAQSPNHISDQMRLRGVINDFTPASTVAPGGPWEVRGHWSLVLKRRYCKEDCKADFSAALTMERSDLGVIQNGGGDLNNPMDRMAHTHHITLTDGEVTTIAGGIQVTGLATITANGSFPPPFGSVLPRLTVEVTGGTGEDSVPFSNVTLLFGAPAASHFGTSPLHGVVIRGLEKSDAAGH